MGITLCFWRSTLPPLAQKLHPFLSLGSLDNVVVSLLGELVRHFLLRDRDLVGATRALHVQEGPYKGNHEEGLGAIPRLSADLAHAVSCSVKRGGVHESHDQHTHEPNEHGQHEKILQEDLLERLLHNVSRDDPLSRVGRGRLVQGLCSTATDATSGSACLAEQRSRSTHG